MRNPKLAIVLCCLVACHALVLFAGFFAPYDPAEQFRDSPFARPVAIRFFDASSHFHLRPFVQVEGAGLAGTSIHFLVSGSPYNILGLLPSSTHLFGVQQPAHMFLFGTDAYGRDQLSRFLYGGQISIAVGMLAAGLTLSIGTVAGLFAGFYGGAADSLLMRGSEFFLSLPWVYLLLGIRAILPLAMRPESVFFLLVAVIGVLGWARPARLVRGIVMSSKTLPFVLAARQLGASNGYLMRRHVMPETYGVLLAQAALLIPQYIAAEVTLSFFGLGISEPLSSWGTMLGAMRELSIIASYWWVAIPALLLVPFFFGYQVLAQNVHRLTAARS